MTFQVPALRRAAARPISRRQAFGLVGAATALALLRRLPREDESPQPPAFAWQPPPAYDAIVGVL